MLPYQQRVSVGGGVYSRVNVMMKRGWGQFDQDLLQK